MVVFKPVPFLSLYFNCPVFTLDDYTVTSKVVNFAKFSFHLYVIRGPRTDPRGMPQFVAARPDLYPFIDIYRLRLDR